MFQKLFKANQIKQIDQQTILRQNISSWELMERAATRLFEHIFPHLNATQEIYIFCGQGNNGGDALVLARLFLAKAIKVKCYEVSLGANEAPDFALNKEKFRQLNGQIEFFNTEIIPEIKSNDLIIDGIFGTGLSRPANGMSKKAIEFINNSGARVISIDLPSGLYADKSNHQDDAIVKADVIYTFQFPKISFFYPENALYVPQYKVVDIGLDTDVIDNLPTNYYLLTEHIKDIIKQRPVQAHKNTFGHALLAGGSYGMYGSVILASKAALRIGAGLVTNLIPQNAYSISQTYVPEVMTLADQPSEYLTKIKIPDKINAVGIGMGMGQHPETQKALKKFLKKWDKALLLDADALNILSLHPQWLKYLPNQSIITPHPGEFQRLAGSWNNDTNKLEKLKNLANKFKLIAILKGAYTTISDGKNFYINPIANPALATAGSGDVLSGIITGLLAQNYSPLKAALLGVYLHGVTAESYTKKYNSYSMIASDIIKELKYL